MTDDDREPRLPRRAEELLEGWPAPLRGALAWEESASAVMARVRQTDVGSTPDELLEAPLPEELDEGEKSREPPKAVQSEAPPRGERSLADIARAALAGPDAANREVARDGLIAAELGRRNPQREAPPAPPAIRDAAGLQGRIVRVPEPAPRSAPLAPRNEAPRAPPKEEPLVVVPAEAAMPPFSEAAARSEFPAPAAREPRRFGAAAFGSTVLAIAAALALYVSFERREKSEARLTPSAEARAPIAARETTATPAVAEANADPAEASAAPSALTAPNKQIALNDLEPPSKSGPSSTNAPKEKSLAFHVKKESAASSGKLVLEERDEPLAEKPSPPRKELAPPPPAQDITERPSTGAVSAALGPVLMSARSCLVGQETGPRATVTFDGKTGRVKSVTLEGSGAGTPADGCVRTALMGARLPPFADPTFTASVTVRPL